MEKYLRFRPNCAPKSTSQRKMEEVLEEEITASKLNQTRLIVFLPGPTKVNSVASTVEIEQSEVEVAEGEEWKRYSEKFYKQCKARADAENDNGMKQKLVLLGRKVKKIDDEIERHSELLKEIEQSPTDINAVVAKRRNEEFFRHLSLLSETYDSLDDRDDGELWAWSIHSIVKLMEVENAETLDVAQAKFDDILNSPSLDAACEKIKSLGKAKELDSSLILLINSAWGAAKESTTMKNESVFSLKPATYLQDKDIMYHLYKATKSSLRSIAPKEIKLLKDLLNITYPEERFSALATAFSPGDEKVAKDPQCPVHIRIRQRSCTIKIMLDAYHLNKEESEIREARQLTLPIVMQRLFILKETIEEEYLQQNTAAEDSTLKEL
ncbi:hypothetical protein C5167_001911 [Papaver somniferum]|uniref:Uncharacterized protein n=1 Tax=Papaver somniferum TaxID=3469 RepID=A0A4Y7L067_PAPSO|nr:hypothetical protein C5167_001911 [Papaver somniferum]